MVPGRVTLGGGGGSANVGRSAITFCSAMDAAVELLSDASRRDVIGVTGSFTGVVWRSGRVLVEDSVVGGAPDDGDGVAAKPLGDGLYGLLEVSWRPLRYCTHTRTHGKAPVGPECIGHAGNYLDCTARTSCNVADDRLLFSSRRAESCSNSLVSIARRSDATARSSNLHQRPHSAKGTRR